VDTEIKNFKHMRESFTVEQQANIFYEAILMFKGKISRLERDIECAEGRYVLGNKNSRKIDERNKELGGEVDRLKREIGRLGVKLSERALKNKKGVTKGMGGKEREGASGMDIEI
jgi:hypothetical protein